jgi:hypothetical protein
MNLKTIGIVVVGLVILGIIIFFIVQNYNKNKGNRAENKENEKELKGLNNNPKTAQKITKSEAAAMANAIFAAIDGYGTDSAAVSKQLMRLQNHADWLALSDAFGIREISSGKLNPEPNFKGTLQSCLTNEFGATDTTFTNLLNKYFKAKGIKVTV